MNTITLNNKEYKFKFNLGTLVNLDKSVKGNLADALKNQSMDAISKFIGFTLVDENNKPLGIENAESLDLEEVIEAVEFVMTEFKSIEPKLNNLQNRIVK